MTGLGATESGVDRRVFGIFSVALTLVFIALGPVVSVLCFGSARVAGTVAATGQPTIFVYAKVGHESCEGFYGLRLFLDEVLGKPFVTDAVFEGF